MTIDADLAPDQTKLGGGYRFFLLVAGRAGGFGMDAFKRKIFIVLEKGGGFKLVLVVAFFAVTRGVAAAMNVFVTDHAFLLQSQEGGRARLFRETGEYKGFLTLFLMTLFAGEVFVASVQLELDMGMFEVFAAQSFPRHTS